MKNIIAILLFTIFASADQNDTNTKYYTEKQLLQSEIKLLKEVNNKLQNNLTELEVNYNEELENKNTLYINSIPKINLSVEQPINWYLILLPITTIVVVIVGFFITRRQLINTSTETIHALDMTLKHEKEKTYNEIINSQKQIWVTELRNEVLSFKSTLVYLAETKENEIPKSKYQNLNDQRTKIDILLNNNEKKHKLLNEQNLKAMEELKDFISNKRINRTNFNISTTKLIKTTKEIINDEFKKIKV